jgi:hypothetical protein
LQIYGAAKVEYLPAAEKKIELFTRQGTHILVTVVER